ncbi:MAG: hypothetical protein ACRD8Z_08315, partial [Nitrososphaeraceae archaeon]
TTYDGSVRINNRQTEMTIFAFALIQQGNSKSFSIPEFFLKASGPATVRTPADNTNGIDIINE